VWHFSWKVKKCMRAAKCSTVGNVVIENELAAARKYS